MDLHRFLSDLPQSLPMEGSLQTSPRESLPQEHTHEPSRANRVGLLAWSLHCLDPDEVYCQIGIAPEGLAEVALANGATVKAVFLPCLSEAGSGKHTTNDPSIQPQVLEPGVFFPQLPELTLAHWSQHLGSARIGICCLPQFTDYRTHLLTLLHCQPWLSDRAIVITFGAQWSGLKQANLDFIATHPQTRIGLSLGLSNSTDTRFGDGIQVLIWEPETVSETDEKQWQTYHRISQALIETATPSTLAFRFPQSTVFPSQIVCMEDVLTCEENLQVYIHASQKEHHFFKTAYYDDTSEDPELHSDGQYRQSLKLDLESFPDIGQLIGKKSCQYCLRCYTSLVWALSN